MASGLCVRPEILEKFEKGDLSKVVHVDFGVGVLICQPLAGQ